MPNPIPGWRDAPFKGDGTQDLTHAGSPPSWNSLLCNGERLPGLAILVSGPNHKLVSFHGRASGKSPGAPTVRGREPATMTFQLLLRDNAEWDSFVAVAPRLLPIVVGAPAQQGTAGAASRAPATKSRTPGAIQISYPLVTAFGVRWVLVKEVSPQGPKGGGPVVINIVFEETQEPTNMPSVQARPKATGLESAPTIDIAGSAPRPPSLRDVARKPVAGAR